MKILIKIFSILIISNVALTADFSVYEANYPDVKDYNVNVDRVSLDIKPQGAYVETTLQMTISYDFESWFFKNYNELEFLWDFTLPDQASIIDFWIQLGDSMKRATILDKWTAELLFSEVSSPVRHPALLTQSFPDREGQVRYNLRLYPVMREQKRTFKITYLLPARPTNRTLRVWLPTSQLTSRKSPGADTLYVQFLDENRPTLLGAEIFSENYDTTPEAWQYAIGLDFDRFVELVYPSPITGKYFFGSYQAENGESFYQLAVYPPPVPQSHLPRNFVILVDYNRFNTSDMDGELVLLMLKEIMQQALTAADSANIFVGFHEIRQGTEKLLPCDEQHLDMLFQNVLMRSFPSYSNFQSLIAAAANFLDKTGSRAEIVLLTNTDEINPYLYGTESFAEEIISMFPSDTKIHVIDLEDKSNLIYNPTTSQYEAQLWSFYGVLCNKTGGNLFSLRYHSIKNILAAIFYEHISHFQEVEVQTRFAAGYAYGKHLIATHEGYYPLQFPIMQVGRFQGALPLDVTVLGKVRLQKYLDDYTIPVSDVKPGDETLVLAWYADHIRNLLKKPQTNLTIMEIMDISLERGILTPYSGLLVFRPGEDHGFEPSAEIPQNGSSGGREGNISPGDDYKGPETDVDSLESTQPESFDLNVSAYPNPFNMAVTIELTLPADYDRSELSFGIYNMLGQRTKEFNLGNLSNGQELRFYWDGKGDNGESLASGVYVAVLCGPDQRKTLKLLMIK